MSPAAIHKIEKKGMTPTITSLMRIAGALGRSVGNLIEEHDRLRPVEVTRHQARPVISTSKSGLTLESVAGRYGPSSWPARRPPSSRAPRAGSSL